MLSTKEVLTFDIKVEQRKNEVLIARAALFPELFVEATPATEDGNLAVGVVGLRYTIYSFGERTARISAARAVISQARYQVLTEIDEAVLKVAAQYVDLAVDTAQLSSARKFRAGMGELAGSVRARVNIGAASSIDLNDVEAGLLTTQSAIADAQAEKANSLSALSSTIGIEPRSVVSISKLRRAFSLGKSERPTFPPMENFPTVAALKEAVTVAEFEAKATRASLFPKIGVEARVGVDVSSDGMKKSGARIGPSISQTLSLGGGRKQRIMNAQLNLRVAQENLKEEYRLLNLAYRQATSDVSASRLRVVKRREILNLHIKSSQIMREEYELGNRSLRDLIDAEERIFNARTDLNEAYRDQLKDQLSLIKAVNRMSDKFYVAPS